MILTDLEPTNTTLPRARRDLILRPMGDDGRHVVKNPRTGTYLTLGAQESFLLARLDGISTPESLQTAYEAHFGEPLDGEDLDDFLVLVGERGLLHNDGDDLADDDELMLALRTWPIPGVDPEPEHSPARAASAPPRNLLFLRIKLLDPSRALEFLEPRLRFVWTSQFVVFGLLLSAAAGLTVWLERDGFVHQIGSTWGWRTFLVGWAALAITTACHEFAHGLTCKRYGGEVKDIGFLLMFLMPCFYCDVSDAYLFPERWKRVWVTLAGGFCDLVLWSVGVFAWRVAQPETVVHEFAWFVVSLSGVRFFLNINPLLKLDGYYLLGDLLDIHNLRQRGIDHFKAYARALMWGATWPPRQERGGVLALYGTAAWGFSAMFITLTIYGLSTYLSRYGALPAVVGTLVLGALCVPLIFNDFGAGEARALVRRRPARAAVWLVAIIAIVSVVSAYPWEETATGLFQIRPLTRVEVRAPVGAFLREVAGDEGDWISPGQRLARLEIPELASKIAQKRAERSESAAKRKLLQIGPRPQEVDEQRRRVERSRAWRERARIDLTRAKTAFSAELAEIDALALQGHLELDRALETYKRDRLLLSRQALQVDQFRETEKLWKVAQARLSQVEARRRVRESEGTSKVEAELAKRETELADAEAALRLLESGARPEEIDAETARYSRIEEEIRYLENIQERLSVPTPIGGVIATPRLKERIGQYLQEGELIAEVEAPARLEAEISVSEQEMARVREGQAIQLKIRALPFRTLTSRVERVGVRGGRERTVAALATRVNSASATTPMTPTGVDGMGTFTVICTLDDDARELKTGMTGYARILLGPRPLGELLVNRALRLLRTEFWW